MDDLSLLKLGLEGTMKTLLSQNKINSPPYMQINNYNHMFKKKNRYMVQNLKYNVLNIW